MSVTKPAPVLRSLNLLWNSKMSHIEPESPYSTVLPKLQLAWDATSFRALMFCGRYYELSMLEGWRKSNVDIEFGSMLHSALEVYDHARLDGKTRDEGQFLAVKWAMENSGGYDKEGKWSPWGGYFEDMWHCLHKTGQGDLMGKKKCPYAHAGKWHPLPAPEVCGMCGSATEVENRWLSYEPTKDRKTLLRLVTWYCEEQTKRLGDGVRPVKMKDGTHAVEVSFRFPAGVTAQTGEEFELCGHMDGLASFGPDVYVRERKTTKKTLSRTYYDGFSPNVQIDLYDLAGTVLFPDQDIQGIMLEALQTMVGGARMSRKALPRTEPLRKELRRELEWWMKQAERYARDDYWPMNRAACWFCTFKGVCSREPGKREEVLKDKFEKRVWNPLEVRS